MHAYIPHAPYHNGIPGQLTKHAQHGLTLIELIVAITVLAIMMTWAVPGFQAMTARNEVAAEVMRLKTALALARNTAVTRRTTIVVCPLPSPDDTTCTFADWSHPLIVVDGQAPSGNLADVDRLRVLEGSTGPNVTFNRDYPIRYQATGWALGHNGTFEICGRLGEGVKG